MSDTSWSYSSYSTAVQCLRKYKYAYVDKIVPDGPEGGDLVFGSALHSAINAELTGQDGAAVFELYWGSYREKDVEYGRFKWQDLAAIGAAFLRKFRKSHAPRYKIEFAEKRLYADYSGIRIEGTVDYYGEYDGRKSLRDFKTSGRNYESDKAQCALQLALYSYLILENGIGTPETLGYTVFNKAAGSIQDLTWDFSRDKMIEALEDLRKYTIYVEEGHKSTVDYPRNLNACLDYSRKCQYYNLCHGNKEKDK